MSDVDNVNPLGDGVHCVDENVNVTPMGQGMVPPTAAPDVGAVASSHALEGSTRRASSSNA